MRTLEQFQKEVLAPLRKERDDKHAAALKIKTFIHALITDVKGDDNRIKGSSITVTSKGHEYIIFETARGYTCCIHSASCPCEKNHLKR